MNENSEIERIAAELRARRKQLSLTQVELAELAGVSVRFVHDLENGKPTVQFAKVLAVAATVGCEFAIQTRRQPQG